MKNQGWGCQIQPDSDLLWAIFQNELMKIVYSGKRIRFFIAPLPDFIYQLNLPTGVSDVLVGYRLKPVQAHYTGSA